MKFLQTLAAVGVVLVAVPAFAQTYTKVTSRASLGATDEIDWAQRPANSAVPNGTDFDSSVFGLEGEVFFANGPGRRLTSGVDWFGGFQLNEALLWTQNGGPLTILFSDLGVNGVYGVGSQVWFNYPPLRDASIDLLGEDNTVLANFAYTTGGGDTDGVASFIGGTSSSGDIKGIRFNGAVSGLETNDFAINKLSLKIRGVDGGTNGGGNTGGGTDNGGNTGGGGQEAVPEPGEWAAMGILGLGLAGLVVRKRRA